MAALMMAVAYAWPRCALARGWSLSGAEGDPADRGQGPGPGPVEEALQRLDVAQLVVLVHVAEERERIPNTRGLDILCHRGAGLGGVVGTVGLGACLDVIRPADVVGVQQPGDVSPGEVDRGLAVGQPEPGASHALQAPGQRQVITCPAVSPRRPAATISRLTVGRRPVAQGQCRRSAEARAWPGCGPGRFRAQRELKGHLPNRRPAEQAPLLARGRHADTIPRGFCLLHGHQLWRALPPAGAEPDARSLDGEHGETRPPNADRGFGVRLRRVRVGSGSVRFGRAWPRAWRARRAPPGCRRGLRR